MNRLLFVVRSFSGSGALSIRFRQILKHLRTEFDVHVLEITHGKGGVRTDNGITIHSKKYSQAGRILNPPVPVSGNTSRKKVRRSRWQVLLKRFIRSLLFPDSFVTEAFRVRREALRLAEELKCDAVNVSAFPFTTLICLKAIKQKLGIKTILDVGDPFFRNSRNGKIKDFFARRYEMKYLKYTDILVVNNAITRDHYLRAYHNCLNPDQIRIVPDGVDKVFISEIRASKDPREAPPDRSQFRLIYAGQLYRRMREPFELYKAVKALENDYAFPKIRLDMYGSLSKEFVAGVKTSNFIFFHGQASHEDLAGIFRNTDLIVFIDNAYGMQTPGKIFEIAFTGRPVLFISDNDQSPAREIIRDMNHVFTVENRSDKIVSAIRKIRDNVRSDLPPSNPPNDLFWESRAAQYKNILTELISGQKS